MKEKLSYLLFKLHITHNHTVKKGLYSYTLHRTDEISSNIRPDIEK